MGCKPSRSLFAGVCRQYEALLGIDFLQYYGHPFGFVADITPVAAGSTLFGGHLCFLSHAKSRRTPLTRFVFERFLLTDFSLSKPSFYLPRILDEC